MPKTSKHRAVLNSDETSKPRAVLNSDETPIHMRAVVPSEASKGVRSGGKKGRGLGGGAGKARPGGSADGQARYKIRTPKRVGSGRMPPPADKERRQVRVSIKTHDRGRGAYRSAPVALLNYIAKEDRTFDREREISADDREDIKAMWRDDRLVHHWIVSPQDGDRMTVDEVKDWTRSFMASSERQTGRVDWLAGAEWKADSAHPEGKWHVHVAVRGVQDGRDLTFHPIHERYWLRHHAEEAATDVLGWKGGRSLEEEHTRREKGRDLVDERVQERGRGRDMTDEMRERERPARRGRDGMEREL